VWEVPPLAVPELGAVRPVDRLAQSDAVRLFVVRARAVVPTFGVTEQNAPAIAQICRQLDGLPLALELAAAWVRTLAVEQIAARLDDRFRLLTGGSRTAVPRQQTLRGAIAWSYDLLDDGTKRLFARCAVFVAGAQLEQLEAVCGPGTELGREVLEGVSELVDQSLLRQSEVAGEPRFRMLVTIRDYALEKLEVGGEQEGQRTRHLASYIALAERAQPELQGKDQKRWLDRVELEHDNLRAALEFAITGGRADDAARLVYALWRFWQVRGYLREGRGWAERTLALAGATPALRLRALEATGGLVYWMGDVAAMLAQYGAALELARQLRDPKEVALAAYNLSFAYTIPNADVAVGRGLLEEALPIFRDLGDTAGLGRASFALANVLSRGPGRSREDLVLAQRTIGEALQVHRTLSNQFDLAWDLHMVGLVALKLDDRDVARQAWTESARLLAAAGDMSGLVLMLSNFAELAKASGDLDRHDVLVGAWAALAKKTGVGLTAIFGLTEARAQPDTIPAERQPAVQRGFAMTLDDALAYALATEPAKIV
jgi:non-specific serine/threonine protein kinase